MIPAVMSCFLIPVGHLYCVQRTLAAPVAVAEKPCSDSGWPGMGDSSASGVHVVDTFFQFRMLATSQEIELEVNTLGISHSSLPATATNERQHPRTVDSGPNWRPPCVIVDPETSLVAWLAGIHTRLPCFHGSLLRHDVTRGYVRQQSMSVQP